MAGVISAHNSEVMASSKEDQDPKDMQINQLLEILSKILSQVAEEVNMKQHTLFMSDDRTPNPDEMVQESSLIELANTMVL